MKLTELSPQLSNYAIKVLSRNGITTVDQMKTLTVGKIIAMCPRDETTAYNIVKSILLINGNPFRQTQYAVISLTQSIFPASKNGTLHRKGDLVLCISHKPDSFRENAAISDEPLLIIGCTNHKYTTSSPSTYISYRFQNKLPKNVSGEIVKTIYAESNASALYQFKYLLETKGL